jgi:hypothetical protein
VIPRRQLPTQTHWLDLDNLFVSKLADTSHSHLNTRAVEDEWSHIAFVVSKEGLEKKITLFVNGELIGSHFTRHNVHLPLSCTGCKGSSFLGHRGEARYWRIARTPADIKRGLNGPLSGISDAMREVVVGWWRFDVGSGCFIEDFPHQHLSTFAHGIDWCMEDLKYISWNENVCEPSYRTRVRSTLEAKRYKADEWQVATR